uniref:Uncharacterized protein n=1 Tax=Panagrolaimus superbus TaxID=310955 RepID=A0A914Y446_9BILA
MRKAPLCYRLGIYDSSKTFSFEHSFFITPTDLDHNGLKNIFVTNSIVSNSLDCYAVQKILPKLFKCDAKVIKIDNQILSFDQFCFLVGEGSVEKISFRNVSVQWKSGEKVAVEFLIERLPNAKCLEFLNAEFNSETSQQLGKIQLLNKIEHFSLGDIDETFEIFGFSKFIQNNGNADSHYTLHFKRIVATAFKFEFEKNLDMAVNPYRHRHASSVRKPEINIY